MDDSGAILWQISAFKDMLDRVNEEIETNIQITREIESEIVKCSETESNLSIKESELTKSLFASHFEINGLISVAACSRNSVKSLEEELCFLRRKRDELLKRMNQKREEFAKICLDFQRDIGMGENDEIQSLLSEKEILENQVQLLDEKNNALKNSMLAFMEEILDELNNSNAALHAEILNGNKENEKLLKEIDELKSMLLPT